MPPIHHGYIVVEGPHDVEFIYRLLSLHGMERVRLYNDLDGFWHKIVPPTFPHRGDLQARVPVPLFLANETHGIAVHAALGDARIVQTIEETLSVIGDLDSIGIVMDADENRTPMVRFNAVRVRLAALGLHFPVAPGELHAGPPRTGAFVLPDNNLAGTLETLLLECGEIEYPQLLEVASAYIAAVDQTKLTVSDLEGFVKNAGRKKAIVNAMASVLKPGKAIQTSIQDNRWLKGGGVWLARVQAVRAYLADLLAIA